MFRLFRRAREKAVSEKNFMRFLRYATGEIILVVIGILIALQINNWNEERQEQRQIRWYTGEHRTVPLVLSKLNG